MAYGLSLGNISCAFNTDLNFASQSIEINYFMMPYQCSLTGCFKYELIFT